MTDWPAFTSWKAEQGHKHLAELCGDAVIQVRPLNKTSNQKLEYDRSRLARLRPVCLLTFDLHSNIVYW